MTLVPTLLPCWALSRFDPDWVMRSHCTEVMSPSRAIDIRERENSLELLDDVRREEHPRRRPPRLQRTRQRVAARTVQLRWMEMPSNQCCLMFPKNSWNWNQLWNNWLNDWQTIHLLGSNIGWHTWSVGVRTCARESPVVVDVAIPLTLLPTPELQHGSNLTHAH